MAQRPKRFKRVSVSFPIDLYAKVDAAYRAAPPHSINSWIVEACKAALPSIVTGPERQGTHELCETSALEAGELAEISAEADRMMEESAAFCADLKARREAAAEAAAQLAESAAQELASREFGPKTLAVAARTIAHWNKWEWAKRLEHLRELRTAAVSG